MFYNYYKLVPGYFDFDNIYIMALNEAQNEDILVEVGSYFGKSACFMLEAINHFNKDVKFYTVDPFIIVPNDDAQVHGLGTGTPWDEPISQWAERVGEDALWKAFNWNVKSCPGFKYLTEIIRMESIKASFKFQNDSVKFCFLDDGHSYENMRDEIEVWWPKIKPNGFLGGHDWFSDVNKAVIEFLSKIPSDKRPELLVSKNSWLIRKNA